MANFSGRLTVINSQSSLDNDLLLRAGIPDATQAIFAATQFLLKSRNLNPGQMIIVTGDRGTFGNVGVIVMTDAHAASEQPFTVTASVSTAAAKSPSGGKAAKSGAKKVGAAKGSKKAGGKKSAATSRTAGSRPSASKKTAGRKRGTSKSSSKKR